MEVGIRELKARLSAYLDQVEAGATIRVTDRGRLKAFIVPAAPDPVERGIEEGWISVGPGFGRPGKRRPPVTVPSRPGVRIDDILDEDRGR